jgi:hypothetical protein
LKIIFGPEKDTGGQFRSLHTYHNIFYNINQKDAETVDDLGKYGINV